MSATIPTAAPSAPLPAAEPIPFSRLLRVEFRKSWDTRASFWLLFSIGAIVLVAELIAAIVTAVNDVDDVRFGTFATVAGFVTQILLPVLGIMVVTSEWTQRTAMVTFALEPRRSRVIWAKLGVGLVWTAFTVVVALVLGAIFNLLYGAIAGGTSWGGGAGVVGFVITQAIAMLIGFAWAALVLSTPAAIVIYFAYLFAVPTVLAIGSGLMHWFDSFSQWINFSTAQGPLYDGLWNMSGSEWGKLVVSGLVWLAIPLAIGLRRIMRAEVK
jgi:ABC-type transport system involved in multi-copper enzyme maturation permease subunit